MFVKMYKINYKELEPEQVVIPIVLHLKVLACIHSNTKKYVRLQIDIDQQQMCRSLSTSLITFQSMQKYSDMINILFNVVS